MTLFPPIERSDTGPALYAEPHYQYLQRTARPEFVEIRALIERWLSDYPAPHRDELETRFKSNDDRNFDSAFFELYLYALLGELEFAVDVHPPSPDPTSDRLPDFLVTPAEGQGFLLEATVLRELNDEEAAAQARINTVYDTIDRLASPNFFIGVRYRGAPDTPVPGRRIREFLAAQLADLDPADYEDLARTRLFDGLPTWRFEHDGWELEFVAMPKSPELRGDPSARPLGMFFPMEAKWRNDHERIREALRDKAGAYGELDKPFVIALNSQLAFTDRIDIMQALFGQETFILDRYDRDAEPEMSRRPDGLWTSAGGPRYTRVSGVLVADHLLPWTVGSSSMRYYPNPYAEHPLENWFERLPHALVRESRYEWIDGQHPGEILGVEALGD